MMASTMFHNDSEVLEYRSKHFVEVILKVSANKRCCANYPLAVRVQAWRKWCCFRESLVCRPPLCRYNTHGDDSSCCLRAAPHRPRQARRRARARTPAPRRHTFGWFSPPHSSRMSRAVVLLFFFCHRRSSSLSRAFSLVVASCGAGPRQCASRRATRARCARRACVTGGSRRRSRARMSRVWCSLLLSSSLVLSRRARRSLDLPARRRGRAHHERARGARDARRDAHGT